MEELFSRPDLRQVEAMSGLALAYVGDAIYELLIRTALASEHSGTNGDFHALAVRYVSAKAQAGYMEKLLPVLTPEEVSVFKRGRNARVNSIPVHSTPGQYHAATGFEALFGYLWLTGQEKRLRELMTVIWEDDHAS